MHGAHDAGQATGKFAIRSVVEGVVLRFEGRGVAGDQRFIEGIKQAAAGGPVDALRVFNGIDDTAEQIPHSQPLLERGG